MRPKAQLGASSRRLRRIQRILRSRAAKVFVNTNGGLKADGNPFGATGGAQIFEIFRQLRGEAGKRQAAPDMESPKYGCIQEFEGFGTKSYVSILGRTKNEQ